MKNQQSMTRKQYKSIKKYDHKQMDEFIAKIYEQGFKDGQMACSSDISMSDIEKILDSTKGIGEKRKAAIMNKFDLLVNCGDGSEKK